MTRIFAISDIHYQNTVPFRKYLNIAIQEGKKEAVKYFSQFDIFEIGKELAKISTEEDILLLAGDYDFYQLLPLYFKGFKGRKIMVFGNHDYWFVDNFPRLGIHINHWFPKEIFAELKSLSKISNLNYDRIFKKVENYNIYGGPPSFEQKIPGHINVSKLQEKYVNTKIQYLKNKGFEVRINRNDPIELEDCTIVAEGLWYDYSFVQSKKIKAEDLELKRHREFGINNDGRYIFGVNDKKFFEEKFKCYEEQLKKAKKIGKPIIAVTHFVPHRKLYDNRQGTVFFCAFFGSKKIHEINKKYKVHSYVYGHVHDYTPEEQQKFESHINISGINYFNVSLFRRNHLIPIWESK